MKFFWCLLVLSMSIFNCSIYAEIHGIRELIEYSYPENSLQLSIQEIEQILWIDGINYVTPEMNVLIKQNNIHVEIPRVLTKLYCLELLRNGTQEDYNKFIEAQIASNNRNILKYQSFKKLSSSVKELDSIAYKAIRISTILSSVSKSPKALELALLKLGKDGISSDNVEFMAETMNKAMDIYPLAREFAANYPKYIPLLKAAFLSNTHFRHMLYTEGGVGMFKNLRTAIKLKTIDKEKLNFWYCYWMVNITGFRGHIAQNGSIYLNEDTFIAINYLKKLVFNMLKDPNYNPLEHYLKFRAKGLGIDTLEKNKKSVMVLAHIGAVLRIYSKEQGRELVEGFNSMSPQQKSNITEHLYVALMDYGDPTPTYGPTTFANGLEYSGNNIKNTLRALLPIYTDAMTLGRNLRKSNIIDKQIPISFIDIARRENIQRLFNRGDHSNLELSINKDGVVSIAS
jgi:hypothetical protein